MHRKITCVTCGTSLSGYICFLQEHALLPPFAVSDSSNMFQCMNQGNSWNQIMSQHNQAPLRAPLRHQDVQNQLFHLEARAKITTYVRVSCIMNQYKLMMWCIVIDVKYNDWCIMNNDWCIMNNNDEYPCSAAMCREATRFNDPERLPIPNAKTSLLFHL